MMYSDHCIPVFFRGENIFRRVHMSKIARAEANKARNLEGYGLKIKKYRAACHLSAEQLAEQLQVSLSTVRNWECGLSRPDPEYLRHMFSVLKITPNDFFGIEGVGDALSTPEKRVVRAFRSLDARGQEELLAIGEALSRQHHLRQLEEIRGRILALPDYGRYAAAGAGDGWSQQTEAEPVYLYSNSPAAEADEVITVSGHSMEPGYHDRDRVLVKYCTEVVLGQVYVFSIRGLGCVIKEAAADRLHSRNRAYADIVPGEEEGAELIGRVLGVIRPDMIPGEEELALYREAMDG